MTPDDIRAAIAARPDLQSLLSGPLPAQAIADAMSVGRVRSRPLTVGSGTVLDTLGLEVGNAFLDSIAATPVYRHVDHLLKMAHLRLDSPLVIAGLQSLVGLQIAPGVTFTAAHAQALIALAQEPDPVSEWDVRCAIYHADGSLWSPT